MRSGFFGVLFLALVAIVAGLIGYQAGLTSSAVSAGNAVVVTGGFPGFGTLFFLIFIGFLFFAFAGRRRAWGGGGHWGGGPWSGHSHWGAGYGRGPWAGGSGSGTDASNDPRRQWIAEFHKSLHEADAGTGRGTDTPPTAPPTTPPTAS